MTGVAAKIPAELLYWGHVPPGAADGPDAIRFRFERFLPLPVERLHVATTRLPDQSTLIVGIESERLRAHLAERPDITPDTWELVPASVPTFVAQVPAVAERIGKLNLLHGDFEPAPHRRVRQRTHLAIHLAFALVVILLVIGIERRFQAASAHAQTQRQVMQTALTSVVPPTPGVRPDVQLTMELRRLEQAARDPAATSSDVPAILQGLWRIWPHDLRAQVDTLGVNAERVVLRGRVAGLAEAERLANACAGLAVPGEHFRAEPLQAQQDERGATFLLTLVRTGDGAKP
jgi:hypothetical protein